MPRLPELANERPENIVSRRLRVVGDAPGVDQGVQMHLSRIAYADVEVFCSREVCRNALGAWPTRNIPVARAFKGFAFYAAKNREKARAADFGLMIWDGKSPGSVLNVLRLIKANKMAGLFNCADSATINFKGRADLEAFLAQRDAALTRDLKARASPEEWCL